MDKLSPFHIHNRRGQPVCPCSTDADGRPPTGWILRIRFRSRPQLAPAFSADVPHENGKRHTRRKGWQHPKWCTSQCVGLRLVQICKLQSYQIIRSAATNVIGFPEAFDPKVFSIAFICRQVNDSLTSALKLRPRRFSSDVQAAILEFNRLTLQRPSFLSELHFIHIRTISPDAVARWNSPAATVLSIPAPRKPSLDSMFLPCVFTTARNESGSAKRCLQKAIAVSLS